MRDRVKHHLGCLRTLSILPFSLILAAYALALRLIPAFVVALILIETGESLPLNEVPWFAPIVIAPVVETLVFQWFPIVVTSRLTPKPSLAIVVSAVLFSAAHYDAGILSMLIAAPSGLVLAWAFMVQRDKGIWPALSATALVHMWVNVAVGAIRLLSD